MNILLVEDNPADMRLMKNFIEDSEMAQLEWVTDGYQALDYVFKRNQHAQATRPDVILLDLGLPRIDGYDVLKEIREHDEMKQIPVVILSTSCSPLDRRQCQALGADMFLSKPRSVEDCKVMVDKLVKEEIPRMARRRAS